MALVTVALSAVRITLLKQSTLKNTIQSTFNVMMARRISSYEVTKNIRLITYKKKKPNIVDLRLESPENKPLVVMLSWLMAKRKHVIKYADFYLKRGFDVVNISASPWQLLWPLKGTQVIASDVLKFLDQNVSFSPMLIHGFSVGGYLWSEVMVQMAVEQGRYQHIIDRIIGQIWDSAADVTEIPEGVPVAVFPRNKVLQSALKQYIVYHLKTFDKVATCHYVRGSQMFHTNLIRSPALFFISKTDTIGSERSNQRVRENWENMGIKTFWKSWDETPHVGHYRHYPEEYVTALNNFLQYIGIEQPTEDVQKLQAKL